MRFHGSIDEMKEIAGGRWDGPLMEFEPSSAARQQELMGEYVLVEAVLREAIREYQKFAGQQGRRGARLFREVYQWFLADDREWDFSFINICQILDLEPTYIREGLRMWHERNVQEVQEAAHLSGAALPASDRQRPALRPH
jgi:hypothetical protein